MLFRALEPYLERWTMLIVKPQINDAPPPVAGRPTASIAAPISTFLSSRTRAWVKRVRHGYWITIEKVYVTMKITLFFKEPLQSFRAFNIVKSISIKA